MPETYRHTGTLARGLLVCRPAMISKLTIAGLLIGSLLAAACTMPTQEDGDGEDPAASQDALSSRTDFYAIAHMTNTPAAAIWAVSEGANGVEIDLRFREDGTPDTFRHGGGIVCDCICSAGQSDHVCRVLHGCEDQSSVSNMFATLAPMSTLALVMLDTKITGAESVAMQEAAGARIVKMLTTDLFGKGYRGKVVISAAKTDVLAYIASAAKAAASSPYRARIYFAFDQTGKTESDAACTLKTLSGLPTKNRVFGTGISACGTGDYKPAIRTAANNENAGVSGFTYVWTLDSESSMRGYIDSGARGILTNRPKKLVDLARRMGRTLARPESAIPAATSNTVLGNAQCGCDCDYHPGGCVISKPAPAGQACKCSYKGAWTCGGSVTACSNPGSPLCRAPDTSIAACALGGGDCDGYAD
jgi:glycerophosphoryl diester phosphodiesterase